MCSAIGYKDPLGIESVCLTNKILNDLIKTTEAFLKTLRWKRQIKVRIKITSWFSSSFKKWKFKIRK